MYTVHILFSFALPLRYSHTLRANCDIQKVNSSPDCTLETNTSLSELCQLTNDTRLWIFTALIAIALLLYIIRAVLIYTFTINSSRVLHNRMFASVLRAPARFFDTNPSGEEFAKWACIPLECRMNILLMKKPLWMSQIIRLSDLTFAQGSSVYQFSLTFAKRSKITESHTV